MEQSYQGPAVVVRDLYKEFYRDKLTIPVLMGTNLQVERGDYLALMGPSGSGKTTLLNLIAGLDRPTSRRGDRGRRGPEPAFRKRAGPLAVAAHRLHLPAL